MKRLVSLTNVVYLCSNIDLGGELEEIELLDGEKILHKVRPAGLIQFLMFVSRSILNTLLGGCIVFVIGIAIASSGSGEGLFGAAMIGGTVIIYGTVLLFIIAIFYSFYLVRDYMFYVTNMRCIVSGGIMSKFQISLLYSQLLGAVKKNNFLFSLFLISNLKLRVKGTYNGKRTITWYGHKDIEKVVNTINNLVKESRSK